MLSSTHTHTQSPPFAPSIRPTQFNVNGAGRKRLSVNWTLLPCAHIDYSISSCHRVHTSWWCIRILREPHAISQKRWMCQCDYSPVATFCLSSFSARPTRTLSLHVILNDSICCYYIIAIDGMAQHWMSMDESSGFNAKQFSPLDEHTYVCECTFLCIAFDTELRLYGSMYADCRAIYASHAHTPSVHWFR